jgi:signal transduction histidine kinase
VQRAALQATGWSGRHLEYGEMLFLKRRSVGYTAAVTVPILIIYAVTWLNLPPFLFEHLIVLLVVAVAIPWGGGPATVAAVVSVGADNLLLREPFGRPTISGYRDVGDLALFAIVAVVVSDLVRRAHQARVVAQASAARERRAREELDRLIATITHDLATPLSVLRNTIQFARRRPTAEVDWAQMLIRLDTASARATSIMRMLSDAQAIESDDLSISIASCDLAEVVAPIVTMMDRASDRHPLILTLPQCRVLVDVDAPRIQRVLENLISNAIKYSPKGGAVEVSVDIDGAFGRLRVRDYGIGISPEALPHIFERSYRAPGAHQHASGLGLGLSIAAEVVHRHGGTIVASPAEGRGSVFSVLVPLTAADGTVFARDRVTAGVGT